MPEHAPESIVALLAARLEESSDRIALWNKLDEWKSRTWDEVGRDVLRTAAWLAEQGVEPGERVSQLSENRYEWILADLAIHVVGAVHVPIHAPLTGKQAAFQIRDSGSRVVLLSDSEQVVKLAACAEELPKDIAFYTYDSCHETIGGQPCRHLAELLPEYDGAKADELMNKAVSRTTSETLATILYTSGTTGEPKGVMLNNRNLVSNTVTVTAPFAQGPDDVRLCFLPLSHIFARTCDLYTWVTSGSQLALAATRDSVLADCADVRPTLLNGVPYFFEKVGNAVAGSDDPNALRDLYGGRIRLCCSGGAALPMHVFDFYRERDIPLLQGYGLTESSPVITLSSETDVKWGAVGRAIPDVEIKIAEDGEILTRGPHVMVGYYKNQAATEQVIQDNWLYTGDIGHLDEEGYLFITGRKKELIVTAGGKNISPVNLESLLTQDPLIAQAVVIGDDRKYLSALIVPEESALDAEIASGRIKVANGNDRLQDASVLQLFEERIAACLATVSHYEQIAKFTLMDRNFTVESGEMTPKLSLRRNSIQTNCCDLIEAMYAPR
jgi:long-chain acyl-CoA synthetase